MDDSTLPRTQADIDRLTEEEVHQHLARVAQQIPVDRVSHPEWVAKEEYRLLIQRLVTLQSERVECWTQEVHDWTRDMRNMTKTIKDLTLVMTIVTIVALLVAIASLVIAVHGH